MNFKNIFLSLALASTAFGMSAQETVMVEESETVYRPNWYVQGQFGFQETLGETTFGNLMSPNAQVGLGYNFNPLLGLRLSVNGWQSKGSIFVDELMKWKWNYVAPTLDVTLDVTNLLGGYNPNRLVSFGIFGGVGANYSFNNDEAVAVNDELRFVLKGNNGLRNIWKDCKTMMTGRFGANLDFNITNNIALGVEAQANFLSDKFNSKRADNADWYFNVLGGIKYTFGGRTKKVAKTVAVPVAVPCEPQVVEKIVEKIVEVPVATPVQAQEVKAMPIRRDIFFSISANKIAPAQMDKVNEVIEYLKANPAAKVTVTGYADKGTGSQALNLRLSAQRANAVSEAIAKAGIAADRIITKSMGEDMYQPYIDPIQNRVAICIAE